MAYTQAPETQTYSTQQIPVVYNLGFRSGASVGLPSARREEGMINLIPRRVGQSDVLYADTRPAIANPTTIATGLTDPIIRGYYVWEYSAGSTALICVVGNTVYSNGGAGWVASVTLTNNITSIVGFTEFITDSSTKMLILVDGYQGYKITFAGTLVFTEIVDADFPTPHAPFPIFLDGYLFLAKKGTGDIYNSDLNDPTAWTAGSFISSEVYPDDLQALLKIDNYILAVGLQGSEYFYDAGNASGSPLARYEGGILPFGTVYTATIASSKDTACLLAKNNDGELVLKTIEGLKHKDIPCSWLTPYISTLISTTVSGAELVSITNRMCGHFIRIGGELLYGLRVPTTTISVDNGYFVYSFSTNIWTEWTGASYGRFPVQGYSNPVYSGPYTQIAYFDGTSVGIGILTLNGSAQDVLSTTASFPIEIRTDRMMFGTLNLKQMHRFGVRLVNSNGDSTTNLAISYSDTDNNTWSSLGTITAAPGTNFPFITQLGAFRQRAMKVTYTGTYAIRFDAFHVDINKGQQ